MKLRTLLFCSFAFTLGAGELTTPEGVLFRAENVQAKISIVNPGWNGASTQDKKTVIFPGEAPAAIDGFQVRNGTFNGKALGNFAFEERRKGNADELEFHLTLKPENPVNVQMISANLAFPVPVNTEKAIAVNGRQRVRFPEHFTPGKQWQITIPKRANTLEIPLNRGTLILSGNFEALIQDNRRFNGKDCSVRLHFTPSTGLISSSSLAFRARYTPYSSHVLLPKTGKTQSLGGITFAVTGKPLTVKEIELKLSGKYLYALSAGDVPCELETVAGNKLNPIERFTVRAEGEKLFCTVFPLNAQLRKLKLRSGNVLALSVSHRLILTKQKNEFRPITIMPGKNWKTVDLKKDVIPGSALDFSHLLDAPAGKYGFVQVAGNHFEFEKRPGIPVRFWGTNISSKVNFMTNQEIDTITARLAANGFNLARLHHFDSTMTQHNTQNSTELPADMLDRLDYFLASCRKRGIYVSIDLYMSRRAKKGEISSYPDKSLSMNDYKALALIDDSVRQNLLMYTRNLLQRKNPYTGTSWVDEPALATVSIINEGTLSNNLRAEYIRKRYDSLYKEYNAAKKLSRDAFEHEIYREAYGFYSGELRKMGIKIPFTDLNYIMLSKVDYDRRLLDYVDIHYYWAHPTTHDWPRTNSQDDALQLLGGFTSLAPHRSLEKPFAVTEWNFVWPNPYRSEGGLIVGAYSAFQDYGMLVQFDYCSNPVRTIKPSHIIGFELANDPIMRLSALAGSLFYLRGDVKAGKDAFAYRLSPNALHTPEQFWELGLLAPVGYVIDKTPDNVTVLPSNTSIPALIKKGHLRADQLSDGKYQTSSREIELSPVAQTFKVVTPYSEGFSARADTRLSGKFASVKTGEVFTTIVAASRDGKPLTESKRILILHLTNCLNKGQRFISPDTIDAAGWLPILVRRSTAEMTLRGIGDNAKIYALDLSGKRLSEVPATREKGSRLIRLDNSAGIFAYELVRE